MTSDALTAAAALSQASRPVLMWEQEIEKLKFTDAWAVNILKTTSLADHIQSIYHTSLHALQTHLHSSVSSPHYKVLQPAADLPPVHGEFDKANVLHKGKCDIVCLVMNVLPPTSQAQQRSGNTGANANSSSSSSNGMTTEIAGMSVWDGTTNGLYEVMPFLARAIHTAVEAPSLYDAAGSTKATMPLPALPLSSSSNVSSSPSSSAAAPALQGIGDNSNNSNNNSNSNGSIDLVQKLTLLENNTHTPNKYMGSAVRIRAADASLNQHILRCKPGMWIRIRDLCTNAVTFNGVTNLDATVGVSTHVCQLSPYNW